MSQERPVVFAAHGDRLVGILHEGSVTAEVGIVIVIGGPQYRVGSHRQFVLLARNLATAGIPVLRFDYRGMGDAEGLTRSFDAVDEDIKAAIAQLVEQLPSLRKVVLLGLCDAASASLIYAHRDSRVAGLLLLNPWVRTGHGEAKTYLRHYYLQRLLQKSFWRKVYHGEFEFKQSISGFFKSVQDAQQGQNGAPEQSIEPKEAYLANMRIGLERFEGPIMFLISGRDLTAQEFVDLCHDDPHWKKAITRKSITTTSIPTADHTMSKSEHLEQAGQLIAEWFAEEVLS